MHMNDNKQSFLREKYDFVFSLGAVCACSGSLREAHRQFRSFPFDWVAGGAIAERARMLVDGFHNWLVKEAMVYRGEQNIEWQRKHIYCNTITGVSFIHDFLQSDSFDIAFDKVKAKYDRRINRLLTNIKKSRRVLAVYQESPETKVRLSDNELQTARDILQQAAPGVKVDLLYVSNDDTLPYAAGCYETVGSGIYKAFFCYNAFNAQIPHAVNRKLLQSFFRRIRLSWKLHTIGDILERCRIFYIKKSNNKPYHVIKLFRIPIWKIYKNS